MIHPFRQTNITPMSRPHRHRAHPYRLPQERTVAADPHRNRRVRKDVRSGEQSAMEIGGQ